MGCSKHHVRIVKFRQYAYDNPMRDGESGFHIVEVGVVLAVLMVIGFAVSRVLTSNSNQTAPAMSTNTPLEKSGNTQEATKEQASTSTSRSIWQMTNAGWQAAEKPPECPSQPILTMPIDLSLATSVLYPGQTRGGNYKPHGGFRFDSATDNKISVTSPLDGFVVRGSQYLTNGEIQYTFDVINNCGIMYRFGHLRELSDEFKALTASWPQAAEGDSRTQQVNPPVYIKKGALIATSIGFTKDKNVFVDWGVYDLRKQNDASQSAVFKNNHQQDKELSWHAVCWFDWVSSPEAARIKAYRQATQQVAEKATTAISF